MASEDKYAVGASSSTVADDASVHKSSEKFMSRENLMLEPCKFDKKTVLLSAGFVVLMVVAAVVGVVTSQYTIANLQTYNLPVANSEVNLVNILVTRDKLLIYLPQFPDGSITESQTIIDHSTQWMAMVNRPQSICFLWKMEAKDMIKIEDMSNVLKDKSPVKLTYTSSDNKWSSRRPRDAELSQLGGFIWDSCSAKELLVMHNIGLPPVNGTDCESFCLPRYTISTGAKPELQVHQVNCVPAKCENRF